MAKKKIQSPVFASPKKSLGLGDLLADYSSVPSGLFAMPVAQAPIAQMARPVPTQAEATPYVEGTPYVSEQEVAPVKQYQMSSGLSAESKRQEDLKNISEELSRRNLGPTTEEIAAARAAIGYDPRLQDIETERALAARLLDRAPSQVDLTPLMALSDAWTGSKFADSYKAPKGLQEKLLAQMSGSAEQRRKLEEQVIDYLKVKSGEQLTKNLLQSGMGSSFALGSQAPTPQRAASGPQDKFNPYTESARISKVAQKLNDRLLQHGADLKEINTYMSENPSVGTMQRTASVLARVIGREKGALAEGDVRRQQFDTIEMQLKKFGGYLSGDPGAPAPAKVVEEIKQNVRLAQKLLHESGTSQMQAAMQTEKATEGGKRLGQTVDQIFAPGVEALKGFEYKSDFQKFMEGVQKRQAGGTK